MNTHELKHAPHIFPLHPLPFKAGKGVALVTSSGTFRNQIIEIESVFFFKYIIAQNNARRQKWASSLIPALSKGFDLRKVQRGQNKSHYVNTPIKTNQFSNNLKNEQNWKLFKQNMMNDLQNEVANGGIGNSGGRIPSKLAGGKGWERTICDWFHSLLLTLSSISYFSSSRLCPWYGANG